MTVATPTVTALTPLREKPPCVHRLEGVIHVLVRPQAEHVETTITRNTTVAPTLIPANQYSNSPNEDAEEQVGRRHRR